MDVPERPASGQFSLAEGGSGLPGKHPGHQLKHCLSGVKEGIDFLSAALLLTIVSNRVFSLAPDGFGLVPERLD